jgi:hypothetical protein
VVREEKSDGDYGEPSRTSVPPSQTPWDSSRDSGAEVDLRRVAALALGFVDAGMLDDAKDVLRSFLRNREG